MAPADRPLILVSNDDGYLAPGLKALVEAMESLGEVWVVAPEHEQSATSHSISLHRPLRIREISPRWLAVDGTPTDCSYLWINYILKDRKPSLMVSGINHGPNMADDVTYSGTVAAAMEASIFKIPAIAFSLVSRDEFDFGPSARFAHALVEAALARPMSLSMLLNVNVPSGVDPKRYVVTRLGKHTYGFDVIENTDPRGRKYYWIGGSEYEHEDIPGSDCNAVLRDKLVSVTPLHLDLTDDEMRKSITANWSLDGFERK